MPRSWSTCAFSVVPRPATSCETWPGTSTGSTGRSSCTATRTTGCSQRPRRSWPTCGQPSAASSNSFSTRTANLPTFFLEQISRSSTRRSLVRRACCPGRSNSRSAACVRRFAPRPLTTRRRTPRTRRSRRRLWSSKGPTTRQSMLRRPPHRCCAPTPTLLFSIPLYYRSTMPS